MLKVLWLDCCLVPYQKRLRDRCRFAECAKRIRATAAVIIARCYARQIRQPHAQAPKRASVGFQCVRSGFSALQYPNGSFLVAVMQQRNESLLRKASGGGTHHRLGGADTASGAALFSFTLPADLPLASGQLQHIACTTNSRLLFDGPALLHVIMASDIHASVPDSKQS